MKIDEKTFKAMPADLQALFRKCPNPGSEEVVGLFPNSKSPKPYGGEKYKETSMFGIGGVNHGNEYGDTGSAARFFYCAKAGKSDRGKDNSHPTVKPIKLMRYLVTLGLPPGGILIDPFAGSGTTGMAVKSLGGKCVLIEREEKYCEIAANRIGGVAANRMLQEVFDFGD